MSVFSLECPWSFKKSDSDSPTLLDCLSLPRLPLQLVLQLGRGSVILSHGGAKCGRGRKEGKHGQCLQEEMEVPGPRLSQLFCAVRQSS